MCCRRYVTVRKTDFLQFTPVPSTSGQSPNVDRGRRCPMHPSLGIRPTREIGEVDGDVCGYRLDLVIAFCEALTDVPDRLVKEGCGHHTFVYRKTHQQLCSEGIG